MERLEVNQVDDVRTQWVLGTEENISVESLRCPVLSQDQVGPEQNRISCCRQTYPSNMYERPHERIDLQKVSKTICFVSQHILCLRDLRTSRQVILILWSVLFNSESGLYVQFPARPTFSVC